jgi:hypothetical protein
VDGQGVGGVALAQPVDPEHDESVVAGTALDPEIALAIDILVSCGGCRLGSAEADDGGGPGPERAAALSVHGQVARHPLAAIESRLDVFFAVQERGAVRNMQVWPEWEGMSCRGARASLTVWLPAGRSRHDTRQCS